MKCFIVAFLALAAVANAEKKSYKFDNNQIDWSGLTWRIKDRYPDNVSPGPNYFTTDSVQLNANGSLTLHIKNLGNGQWSSAEIYGQEPLGHGTYSWIIDSDIGSLDPQADFNMFTWEDGASQVGGRQVNMEISKYGYSGVDVNSAFGILPLQPTGRSTRFTIPSGPGKTYAEFTWGPCGLTFRVEKNGKKFTHQDTNYRLGSASETVHTALYLFEGKAPQEGKPVSVTLESFKFTPLAQTKPEYVIKCKPRFFVRY